MKDDELKFIREHTPYLWRFMNKIGFEPDAKDSIDETALMYAIEFANEPTYGRAATILLRNGWDLNTRDIYGKAAIHYALSYYRFNLTYDLLRYDMSEDVLVDALYWALMASRKKSNMRNKVILTLIEKIGGISPEKCPDALLFALGGRGVPYIAPLVVAGFSYVDEKYYNQFSSNYDFQELVFSQFMKHRDHFIFENRDDYPIYIENGMVRARPELYRSVWPPLSRRIKKEFKKHKTRLHTLNYIVSWASSLGKISV